MLDFPHLQSLHPRTADCVSNRFASPYSHCLLSTIVPLVQTDVHSAVLFLSPLIVAQCQSMFLTLFLRAGCSKDLLIVASQLLAFCFIYSSYIFLSSPRWLFGRVLRPVLLFPRLISASVNVVIGKSSCVWSFFAYEPTGCMLLIY
jgi:hypothetical protein